MLKIFKKEKFPLVIFIIASLASLIILGLLVFFFKANLYYSQPRNSLGGESYFKIDFASADPLITRVPQLSDILTGPIIQASDPVLGAQDAAVTVVYFSDFVCAYCGEQEAILRRILNEYPAQARLIWKDYPETDVNSASWRAAMAARCAQAQNKFWEYHDALYANNLYLDDDLNNDFFISLAADLSLDKDAFRTCLNQPTIAGLVRDNILEAQTLGINGIPFIYVNDQEIMGWTSAEDLRRIVETELKK